MMRSPDDVAQMLVITLREPLFEKAQQMVAEVIGHQSSAVEPAQAKQLATESASTETQQSSVDGGTVDTGVPQPDAKGEFASPVDGALWMAMTWGIPQTPLRGKAPFLPEWQKRASADSEQI